MKNYDLMDLADPETYANDEALARLARKACDRHFKTVAAGRMGFGEFKRRLLNGEYPEQMREMVLEVVKSEQARLQQDDEDAAAIAELELPAGYQLLHRDGENRVIGPFDNNLHRRLKRIGHWSRRHKCWVIDAGKVRSLKRIFANWSKHRAQQAAAGSTSMRAAKPKPAQRPAPQRRLKVRVGEYRIGDCIEGARIVGFGQSWSEPGLPDLSDYPVQLWEPCRCGQEPVYARAGLEHMGSQKCARCIAEEQSVLPVTVCYAYLDDPAQQD